MKRKWLLIIFTAVLIAAVILINAQVDHAELPIQFSIYSEDYGENEEISCWMSQEGIHYVFLPAYATLSDVRVSLNSGTNIWVNEILMYDGLVCSDFELDKEYELRYSAGGRKYEQGIVFLKSRSVAAIYIDTESGNTDYIHLDKDNKESGTIRVYAENGTLEFCGEIAEIKGHGNSTWGEYEKKPYNIQLTAGAELLGMDAAQNWVLLANASDSSHMRNRIVYDIAKEFEMEYTPESSWADLYLNGQYRGLYLLSERNEVSQGRVEIEGEGSFLVSQELEERLIDQGQPYVATSGSVAFRIRYPQSPVQNVKDEILQKIQSVENAIVDDHGIDAVTGMSLEKLIDRDSWAKKYLIEEVFGNMDAFYISQYYYCNGVAADDRIYAGPIWDYDLSMGNKTMWQLSSPNIFFGNRLSVREGAQTPWIYALYQNDSFRAYVEQLYSEEFEPLVKQYLETELKQYADQIATAARNNQVRWSDSTDDFETEIDEICDYLTARMEFLDSLWNKNENYHVVRLDNSFGNNYGYIAVQSGSSLEEVPVLDDTPTSRFVGWFYADTCEMAEPSDSVNEDLCLYAVWESDASGKLNTLLKLLPLGVWGVMCVAVFLTEVKRIRRCGIE